jgi:type II secretion system protein L
LEEQLVSDIDELHFATTIVDNTRLSAAVCANEKMSEWQKLLDDIPAVKLWIPEPQLLPWQAGEWTIVLEPDYAIVRTGLSDGFSIERDLLVHLLQAALQGTEQLPSAIIVYGQDQAADGQMLPESLRDRMQWRRGNLRTALLLSEDESTSVNLLQGHFAQRLPLDKWWQQWRLVAAVFAAAFCLQLVASYASYVRLEQENLALRGEIQDSYRRAFPKGALVDPEKQVKRQLDALRGTSQSSGFVSLMNRVGEIVASKPGTAIASINYNDKGGEMRMNITATDFEAVEAIRTSMTASGLDAVMESSSAQGDQVRARLRIGAGS